MTADGHQHVFARPLSMVGDRRPPEISRRWPGARGGRSSMSMLEEDELEQVGECDEELCCFGAHDRT